ncbi:hypothetical protein FRB96_004142 [Tulasnella sp. 330]|nr:hypothetical protein FRB96_004142 [Tulasnella sp. 330]
MDSKETAALWVAALGSSSLLYKTLKTYRATASSVHTLRSPESPSWLAGKSQNMRAPFTDDIFQNWMKEYGSTLSTYTFFGAKEFLIADTQAASFILNHPLEFPKTPGVTKSLFGDGLLAVEGVQHKKQRKVLLREAWKKKLSESTTNEVFQEIDVLKWLSNATLDMIGLAGFGYRFNSLRDASSELRNTFHDLCNNLSLIKGMGILVLLFPFLRHLPIGSNKARSRSRAVMERLSSQMVVEKKAEAEQIGHETSLKGKDFLSLLVRANLQENVAERLDDDELSAEVGTFLLARHDTTALTVSWGLHALAEAPVVRSKLRGELLAFPNDSPSMEELNRLPYLNNVVREILRVKVNDREPLVCA